MNGFPNVDPIPLPAPIWLFKLLHIVTLALHFVAMQVLVGGLLIAVLLNLMGSSDSARTAAAAIARRLTIVMTYVINLGVPPLLFAQVLYGRAIYTSSVMIGLRWSPSSPRSSSRTGCSTASPQVWMRAVRHGRSAASPGSSSPPLPTSTPPT